MSFVIHKTKDIFSSLFGIDNRFVSLKIYWLIVFDFRLPLSPSLTLSLMLGTGPRVSLLHLNSFGSLNLNLGTCPRHLDFDHRLLLRDSSDHNDGSSTFCLKMELLSRDHLTVAAETPWHYFDQDFEPFWHLTSVVGEDVLWRWRFIYWYRCNSLCPSPTFLSSSLFDPSWLLLYVINREEVET